MFQTINLLLDLKIVQYTLCVALVTLLFFSLWTQLKYSALQVDHKFVLGELIKVSGDLHIQNGEIKKLGEQSDIYIAKYNDASNRASREADRTHKTLQDILSYEFEGECSENLNTGLRMLKGEKR